ncbi:MAG: ribonuclease M5 [Peptococcaceae bacterium]
MKIKEVVVVEGKDDVSAVKKAVDAEVITTSGMGITEEILEQIENAAKRCGVVILTDPDFPGNKIRTIISQRIKNCKQAYLNQRQARCTNTGKIGVEYARPQAIREALLQAKVERSEFINSYTIKDLYDWGLTGSSFGGKRRVLLGDKLRIGNTNAKQFLRRLNSFHIPREEIEAALLQMEGLDSE